MKKARKEKIEKNVCWFAPDMNPNLVTFASIAAMFLAAYLVFKGELVLAACLVFISGFFDMLDGAIAKKYQRTSAFGSFFDKAADRISDAVIICAVILAGFVDIGLGLLVLVLILLSSYMSAVIDSLRAKESKKGEELSLRWVRLLVIAGGLAAAQIQLMMFVLLVIGLYSFFDRFVFAARHLKR